MENDYALVDLDSCQQYEPPFDKMELMRYFACMPLLEKCCFKIPKYDTGLMAKLSELFKQPVDELEGSALCFYKEAFYFFNGKTKVTYGLTLSLVFAHKGRPCSCVMSVEDADGKMCVISEEDLQVIPQMTMLDALRGNRVE